MQQCKKYFGDEETKATILKAFKKLFDNGHMVLLRDLKPEEKKFLDKDVSVAPILNNPKAAISYHLFINIEIQH